MMYADDIVLLSESPEGLHNMLDTLHEYCNDWKLSVLMYLVLVLPHNISYIMCIFCI